MTTVQNSPASALNPLPERLNMSEDYTDPDLNPSEKVELAVVLSDAEIEEKHAAEALREAEILRVESEIKPLVIERIRAEARTESRKEFLTTIREQAETIAALKRDNVTYREGMQEALKRKAEYAEKLKEYEEQLAARS